MAGVVKRTFSLPPAQASYIDELVATGGYASASEVVRAGLRALRERDAAVEHWLQGEFAPAYGATQADAGPALNAGQVSAALRAHHAADLKADRREGDGDRDPEDLPHKEDTNG